MSIKRKLLGATAPLWLALLAACSQSSPAVLPAASAPPTSPMATAPSTPSTAAAPSAVDRTAAEQVAARFVERANAGDTAGVEATFARDARFDSAGRLYGNRQEIMQRFLVPEVLEAGGKYHVRDREWKEGRLVVHYRYETGSGGAETFTYSYLIENGLIRDVVGRYE